MPGGSSAKPGKFGPPGAVVPIALRLIDAGALAWPNTAIETPGPGDPSLSS